MKKVGHTPEFPFSIIDELWKTRKIRILKKEKKRKKNCWRYHHFTHVYQKPQSYEIQFLGHGVRQISYVIFGHFLPFDPHNNPKNQNFEKIKKAGFFKKKKKDIILHLCTINDNHTIYGSSDINCNKPTFCHLGLFFALLSPPSL